MRTPITMTKMTTLKIRMAKIGPRKAPKNTAGSKTKQLEGGKRTQVINQRRLDIKNQILELVNESLLVVVL